MVDLDKLRVLHSVGDEAGILPTGICYFLKKVLKIITNKMVSRTTAQNFLVSEAFLLMFVFLCGHYHQHVTLKDGAKVFEVRSRIL
jgi:hypothetical protein